MDGHNPNIAPQRETMVDSSVSFFSLRESSFQGFLGGAGFRRTLFGTLEVPQMSDVPLPVAFRLK